MKQAVPICPWQWAIFALLIAVCPGLTVDAVAQTATSTASAPLEEPMMKIRLSIGEEHATATLYDNATARDFAALLPLSLTMNDYASIERVATLPRKLSTQGAPEGMAPVAGRTFRQPRPCAQGAPEGMAPVAGELTHYAPWGNLAIFIQSRSWSRNLLPLGKVEEGLSILSRSGPYLMPIERISP